MVRDPIDGLLADLRRQAIHAQTGAARLAECTLMELELLGYVASVDRAQVALDQAHDAGRYRIARASRDLYQHALKLHRAGELGA